MIKALSFIAFLICWSFAFSGSVEASNRNKFFCAATSFYNNQARVLHLRGDKLKHCTLSCLVARRCPAWEVDAVGILLVLLLGAIEVGYEFFDFVLFGFEAECP